MIALGSSGRMRLRTSLALVLGLLLSGCVLVGYDGQPSERADAGDSGGGGMGGTAAGGSGGQGGSGGVRDASDDGAIDGDVIDDSGAAGTGAGGDAMVDGA